MAGICSIPDCDRQATGREMCNMHWQRWRRENPDANLAPKLFFRRLKPTYAIWFDIGYRCSNPKNKSYHLFGARGIKIDERWQGRDGFEQFLADMGERPPNHTLARRDNDGDFTPDNCYWEHKAILRLTGKTNRPGTTSGHYGIYYKKGKPSPYVVNVYYKGKAHNVGAFVTLPEAITARDKYIQGIVDEIHAKEYARVHQS